MRLVIILGLAAFTNAYGGLQYTFSNDPQTESQRRATLREIANRNLGIRNLFGENNGFQGLEDLLKPPGSQIDPGLLPALPGGIPDILGNLVEMPNRLESPGYMYEDPGESGILEGIFENPGSADNLGFTYGNPNNVGNIVDILTNPGGLGNVGDIYGSPNVWPPNRPWNYEEFPGTPSRPDSPRFPGPPRKPESPEVPQQGNSGRPWINGLPGRPTNPGMQPEAPSRPALPGFPGEPQGTPSRPTNIGAQPGYRPSNVGAQPRLPNRPGGFPTFPGLPRKSDNMEKPYLPSSGGNNAMPSGVPSRPIGSGTPPGFPSRPRGSGTPPGFPSRPEFPRRQDSLAKPPISQENYPTNPISPTRQPKNQMPPQSNPPAFLPPGSNNIKRPPLQTRPPVHKLSLRCIGSLMYGDAMNLGRLKAYNLLAKIAQLGSSHDFVKRAFGEYASKDLALSYAEYVSSVAKLAKENKFFDPFGYCS